MNIENDTDIARVVTVRRTSALGDTITTRLTIFEGVISEDIVIDGPPELLATRGGSYGSDIYRHESRPPREQRQIWLSVNKSKVWA